MYQSKKEMGVTYQNEHQKEIWFRWRNNYMFVIWNNMYESCKTRNMDQQVKRVSVDFSLRRILYNSMQNHKHIHICCNRSGIILYEYSCSVSNCRHGLRVYITSYSIKKWTQTHVKRFYFLSFVQIYKSLKQSLFGPNIVSPNHLLYSERATNNICKWFCTAYFYMKSINTFPKW